MDQSLKARITKDFTYNKPDPELTTPHEEIYDAYRTLELFIAENTPPGRAQSVALTELQSSLNWARNAVE